VRRTATLLLALLASAPAAAEPIELSAGFGVAPLPVPEGGPMAGYGGLRNRTATGVLDPPEARALVLESDGLRVAIVALDVLIARPRLREALLTRVAGLGVDALVLVATHTHSGPGGYEPGWLAGRVTGASHEPGAAERLGGAAALAVELAVGSLSPARAAAELARVELAENRRFADGPSETALPLLRVDFSDGSDPVVLFAFGAHPTVLSNRSRDYSADYVGAARERLSLAGWRPIFIPGPLGDQQPTSQLGPLWPDELESQREQAREIGERLAGAVLAGIAELEPSRPSALSAAERWVEVPDSGLRRFCALWWFSPLVRRGLSRFLSPQVPFVAVRVDDVLLLALPAEPASSVGNALRAGVRRASVPFVIAHANDWMGYAVSSEEYARGGYEACMSFFGPGLAPWLVDEALRTAEQAWPGIGARSLPAEAAPAASVRP
jgi:hypothetical protein